MPGRLGGLLGAVVVTGAGMATAYYTFNEPLKEVSKDKPSNERPVVENRAAEPLPVVADVAKAVQQQQRSAAPNAYNRSWTDTLSGMVFGSKPETKADDKAEDGKREQQNRPPPIEIKEVVRERETRDDVKEIRPDIPPPYGSWSALMNPFDRKPRRSVPEEKPSI